MERSLSERPAATTIPPASARAIRMASIAPHVAAMFAHLPQRIRIDGVLPIDATATPTAALQLLKLPQLVGDRVVLGDVTVEAATTSITITLGERRCTLDRAALDRDVREVARTILSSLFEGSDVARLLEGFAFQSSNLATLQHITRRMLQATDVDRALYFMLSGITSGSGLSFNRAALFVRDEETASEVGFRGAKAIGPADETEAHRIWEAIELEEKTLDHVVEDSSHQRFDTRFQQLVQSITLRPDSAPNDEVAAALASDHDHVCASLGPPVNASLAPLDATSGFVLAAIRSHGEVRGLLFADNRYTGTPPTAEQLSHLGFWIDQTALIWENLSLLARVDALARTDSLTGVFNRRELESRFDAERSRALRTRVSLSVLVIDIDHFKQVNDARGHAAGDDALRKVGAVLRRNIREHDVAARFGGDEFVVLLPDVTVEQLASAARRLGVLARAEGISLSIGGASWPEGQDAPHGGDGADTRAKELDLHALLALADSELYAAKRAGRGCAFVHGARVTF